MVYIRQITEYLQQAQARVCGPCASMLARIEEHEKMMREHAEGLVLAFIQQKKNYSHLFVSLRQVVFVFYKRFFSKTNFYIYLKNVRHKVCEK